jgi:hypothetical protein
VLDQARHLLPRLRAATAPLPNDPTLLRSLVIVLQYDRDPGDGQLRRRVFDAVTAASDDPETLMRAAFLVAQLRDPADVWRQYTAYQRTPGFDAEYLFAGGVDATLTLVDASDDARRDAVRGVLVDADGDARYPQPEIDAFLTELEREYPPDEGHEDTWTLVTRDLDLGDHASVRDLLDARELEADADELRRIRAYRERAGDSVGALRCARALVDLAGDQPADRLALVRILISRDQYTEAWQYLAQRGVQAEHAAATAAWCRVIAERTSSTPIAEAAAAYAETLSRE